MIDASIFCAQSIGVHLKEMSQWTAVEQLSLSRVNAYPMLGEVWNMLCSDVDGIATDELPS